MSHFSPTRAAVVFLCMLCCFCVLIGRVAYLQTYGRQRTIRQVERQQHQSQVLPARRGSVYDRNGFAMAGTVQTMTAFVDPKFMQETFSQEGRSLVEMDKAVERLAKLIDRDAFELSQLLSDRFTSRFVKVAEGLDEETCKRITKLNLPGVGLQPTNLRYYPMGSIAAHVLGGTGHNGAGLEGLELKFQKLLAGKDGFKRTLKDARRRPISVAADDYLPPQHGQHLILTLDANIQMIAEQELAATCAAFKAKRGEVVVMEPKTGEVLALANWPTFNPQNLDEAPVRGTPQFKDWMDLRRNRCLTDPYEPGSTLKPFIVGPALADRITRVNEVWPIPALSWRTPYNRRITDVHFYGPLSTWDGLVKSSNIMMSMLAGRMGNPRLHGALKGFSFGRPTGVELPGEDRGRLNPLRQWNKFSTESIAQGYEIMVTPLQLARGFCAYANGGRLVQPTIIKGVLDADGRVVSKRKPNRLDMMPEVIDPMTAAEMKRVLSDTVVRGTATKARDATWNIFGKTGTAHISQGKGGYSESRYTSSFLGGAPAENPRLVVAFIIHEPDRSIAHYGGTVSAPGASKLLSRSLSYLQAPASPDLPVPPPQIANVLNNFSPKLYKRKPLETVEAR